jgi:hypothetical protein
VPLEAMWGKTEKNRIPMVNPYEPKNSESSQPELIVHAQPSPKSVLLAFLVGAGAGVFPIVYYVKPPLLFPSFFEDFLLFFTVAYFPLVGLLCSRFRCPLIYCYSGLVFVCVGGAIPWLMTSKFFPLNLLITLGWTSHWWIGVLINLILTGRWRSKPS